MQLDTKDTEVINIQILQNMNFIHIYSTTRRPINKYIPTARYRQPNCTTNKFTSSNNRNSSRGITRLGVLPEGELPGFISDLSALEDWNDAGMHVLGDRGGSYSDGDGYKKQVYLEQREQW